MDAEYMQAKAFQVRPRPTPAPPRLFPFGILFVHAVAVSLAIGAGRATSTIAARMHTSHTNQTRPGTHSGGP
jgi:hypothetical protein